MWIKDTLHLTDVKCSEAFYADALRRDDLHLLEEPTELTFDSAGQLFEAFSDDAVPTSVNQTLPKDDVVH